MNNLSTEAKIGIGIAIVALAAIFWLRSGSREEASPLPPLTSPVRRTPRSMRVQERLAQLREGRDSAEEYPAAERLQRLRGRVLPTLEPKKLEGSDEPVAEEPLPPDTENIDLDDLDFDSLRQQALHDEDPDNRIAAIWLISTFDDDPVIGVLTEALGDADPEVRLTAVQSLSEFSDDLPVETLSMAMNDSDPEVRFEALGVVAEVGGEEMQPLVAKALDDPDEDVRSLAEGIADLDDAFQPPTSAEMPTP